MLRNIYTQSFSGNFSRKSLLHEHLRAEGICCIPYKLARWRILDFKIRLNRNTPQTTNNMTLKKLNNHLKMYLLLEIMIVHCQVLWRGNPSSSWICGWGIILPKIASQDDCNKAMCFPRILGSTPWNRFCSKCWFRIFD